MTRLSGRYAVLAVAVTAMTVTSAAAEPIRVGLDWAWRPYHAPFLIAMGKGYFEDAGLDVEIEEGRGSNRTAIMVGQHSYDLGHLNITNAAHAISKGVPIKVVATYQPKTAASFIGRADKVKLTDVESLKKYRIGSTPGGSDQLSLKIFQKSNNLGPDDLNIVSLDGNTKTAALLAGEIDVVSGDSYAYDAIVRSKGVEPTHILLADHGVPLLGFGFAVNRDYEESAPDKIEPFLEVIKKAWAEVASDVDAACTYIREYKELPGDQELCVNYVNNLLDLSAAPTADDWGMMSDEQWQKLLDTLHDVGEIEGDYEVSDYYTNKYVP